MKSPAYEVLRASSRRLLLFIETEIARQGDGSAVIYPDQFAVVGSLRIIVPGLDELNGLGLLDVQRYPKRAVCKLSERWRDIASRHDAVDISEAAREASAAGADAAATGGGVDQRVIMIEPKQSDIGRKVIYRVHRNAKAEEGVITRFNEKYVFVRFGKEERSAVTTREQLEWQDARLRSS